MAWNGVITNAGAELLAQWASGDALAITKATAGTGTASGSLAEQTALTDQRQMASIVNNEAVDSGQKLTIQLTPAAVAYELNQFGIWGTLNGGAETLLAIFQNEQGVEIPSQSSGPDFLYTFYALLNFSSTGGDLTVKVDTSAFVSASQAVRFDTAQALTSAQQAQARANIGGASTASLAQKPDAVQELTYVYVSPDGSDESGNGAYDHPFLTIQKAVNSLPRVLNANVIISLGTGSYDEVVEASSFTGAGRLTITGHSLERQVTVGAIRITDCTLPLFSLEYVSLTGTYGDGVTNNYRWSFCCQNVSAVKLSKVNCTGSVESSNVGAFFLLDTPTVNLASCTVSNKSIAVDVVRSAIYMTESVTGENNTVGIRCGSGWGQGGGFVQKGGATIDGEEQTYYGGQIW